MSVPWAVATNAAHAEEDAQVREAAATLRLVPLADRALVDSDAHRMLGPTETAGREEVSLDPDRTGLARDTLYFLGIQFAALAVLYASPEGVSGWSEEQIDAAGYARWRENIGKFEFDRDAWWINYALHPYWGAAYHTRARERGFGRWQAFWYSALLSTEYELGAEALFENPSIQDLLVTPIFGSLLARSVEPWRRRVLARSRTPNVLERAGLILSDPLGAINRLVDRLARRSAPTLQVRVAVTEPGSVRRPAGRPFDGGRSGSGSTGGGTELWGIELRMTW